MNYILVTHEEQNNGRIELACHNHRLTAREIEVSKLICVGQTNAQIGESLSIALRTVENHLRSIYEKAGVSSRTQLASMLMSLQ